MNAPAQIVAPAPLHMPAPAEEMAGFSIDLRHLVALVYRNRWLIMTVFMLCVVTAILVTMFSTRIYSASASVQIEQQAAKVLEGSSERDGGASGQEADRFLQTNLDIVQSRALAIRVAESLNLYKNDSFITRMGGKIASAPYAGLTLALTRREQVIALLMRNLQVRLPRNSRIVSIAFVSRDPSLAATVANSYAENFISSNLRRRYDASSYARQFLEEQLGLAKSRLEASERAMIQYSRQAGLLDTSQGVAATAGDTATSGGPRSLTTANLIQLNAAFVAAQAARVAAEERYRAASETPLFSLPEVQQSQAIQLLRQQRAQLQATADQALTRYRSDYPLVQQTNAQIAGLDRQIERLARDAMGAIRNQYLVARAQEDALAAKVSGLREAMLGEQNLSVRYNLLKRESDTNRTMYDGLLQRYKEVSAEAGVSANNISMLDSATRPTAPFSPRPLVNLAIALLAGLALSVLIVLARERFDDAVRTPEDVSAKLDLPFVGTVPLLPSGMLPENALNDPKSGFSEAHFALRTSLQLASPDGLFRSLLVTSGREAEGKSTTSYALAHAFAQVGRRTLLIDGDMRRPSLHKFFGGERDSRGLSMVLARQISVTDAVRSTEIENLFYMPAGSLPPSPTEILSGGWLPEVVAEAARQYDLVIIDGPPVLGLADAVLYATAVQTTVYVVEAGRARNGQGKAAVRRLLGSGGKVLGAILTKFNPRYAGYGYEYSYYYNYGAATTRKSRHRDDAAA